MTINTSLIKQQNHTPEHDSLLYSNEASDHSHHTHEHYHSKSSAHAHQHSHAKTVSGAIDFLFDNDVVNIRDLSSKQESITFADHLISNLFIEEVFRPPIS